MTELIVYLLTALGRGPTGVIDELLKPMREFNPALHQMATTIHATAVKPVTSIVVAIIATMMLATNSTRFEADRELGIKIVAGSMFKVAMVLIACQFAPQILDGIVEVATSIANAANNITPKGEVATISLGNQHRESIDDASTLEQLGMLVLLVIPFLVATVSGIVMLVLVFFRFLQMYLLAAFASLPVAFLSHEDTKSIGIGYLKKFAVAALTGTVLVIAVKMYQTLLNGWLSQHQSPQGNALAYVAENIGNFLLAPVVLIVLLIGANGVAKAIVGES